MRSVRRTAACALWAALAVAAAARADYKESYREGIKSIDRKEWQTAVRLLRQAAAEQPRESSEKVKIYGVRFELYLPHFYLGLALAGTGDCDGALPQFADSESQGQVQSTPHFAVLTRHRAACRDTLAKKAPATTISAQRPPDRPAMKPIEIAVEIPEPPSRPAPTPATSATSAASAAPITAPTPATAPAPGLPNLPSPAFTAGKPPAEIRAAARAFLLAHYHEVVRLLAKPSYGDRRAQSTSYLLLAAARHALFLEGGGKDERLRREALASVRACRRIAPGMTPDPRLFSPRFTSFWADAAR